MSNQKDKQIAEALHELADKIYPPVNQARSAPKGSSSEAAQQVHESALASFSTEEKGRVRQSLNSAATKAEIEAFLAKIQGK
jgi:hypothetical protein